MKNIIITMILFILLTIIIIVPTYYLNRICNDMLKQSDDIEVLLDSEKWEDAYTSSLDLLNSWEREKKFFSIFIPHIEIDNVNMEIYKLSQYVKKQDESESQASLHLVKFLIIHLDELNKANAQNIF